MFSVSDNTILDTSVLKEAEAAIEDNILRAEDQLKQTGSTDEYEETEEDKKAAETLQTDEYNYGVQLTPYTVEEFPELIFRSIRREDIPAIKLLHVCLLPLFFFFFFFFFSFSISLARLLCLSVCPSCEIE